MSVEQALRKTLARAYGEPSWEENPLVTMGLSHAMLSLKVSDHELYRAVHVYIRKLVTTMHPDTGIIETPEVIEERRKIMDAFELLNDEKTFLKALAEFRTLKSEERGEMAILRTSLESMRKRATKAEASANELGKDRLLFERERGAFELEKKQEGLIVPTLRSSLSIAEEARKRWHSFLLKRSKENLGLARIIRWQHAYFKTQALTFEEPSKEVEEMCAQQEQSEGEEKIPEPIKVVPLLPSAVKELFVVEFGIFKPDAPRTRASQKNIPKELWGKYSQVTRRLANLIKKKFEGRMVGQYSLKRIPIRDGWIGDPENDDLERLVGSIQFIDVGRSPHKSIGHLPASFVLGSIHPFLLPGSFLVSVPRRRTFPLLSYDYANELMCSRSVIENAFLTNRIILDAVAVPSKDEAPSKDGPRALPKK